MDSRGSEWIVWAQLVWDSEWIVLAQSGIVGG